MEASPWRSIPNAIQANGPFGHGRKRSTPSLHVCRHTCIRCLRFLIAFQSRITSDCLDHLLDLVWLCVRLRICSNIHLTRWRSMETESRPYRHPIPDNRIQHHRSPQPFLNWRIRFGGSSIRYNPRHPSPLVPDFRPTLCSRISLRYATRSILSPSQGKFHPKANPTYSLVPTSYPISNLSGHLAIRTSIRRTLLCSFVTIRKQGLLRFWIPIPYFHSNRSYNRYGQYTVHLLYSMCGGV